MSELDVKTLPDAIVESEVNDANKLPDATPVENKVTNETTEEADIKQPVDSGDSKQPAKAKNPRVDRVRKESYNGPKKNGNIRKRTESWSQKDLQLSRALAGILRYGMMGFQPDEHGFLFLDDILQHHHFKGVLNVTYEDLKRVCKEIEDKKGHTMFELVGENDGKLLKVRARKSDKSVGGDSGRDEEVTLKKAAEYPVCIHGTYWKAWEDMKQKGISRLGRNHIHFCSGMIGKDGNVSGIRPNCEVLVYLDLKKAISDRIKFYRDERGVLWSDGNKEGFIPPKYFTHAVHVSPTTGQQIYCEDLADLKDNEGEARVNKPTSRPPSSARGGGSRGGGSRGGGRGERGARGGRGGRGGGRGGNRNRSRDGYAKDENAKDEEGQRKPAPKNNRNNRNRNRNQKSTDAKSEAKSTDAKSDAKLTDTKSDTKSDTTSSSKPADANSSKKTAEITEKIKKIDLKKDTSDGAKQTNSDQQ